MGGDYRSGRSMFTVYTANPMSFWTAAVSDNGIVAVRLAEPLTRYWFELTSLVDWSAQRYAGSIDAENRFGVDATTGATRTAQNSVDAIAGATVRVSRESTAYQRALVAAGILDESEVVIGRF